MEIINFKKGMWEDKFRHVYNLRFDFKPEFIQEEDCISNGRNPGMSDGFDYTTIMTKQKYKVGTKITLTCSFEEFGAPLIMLADTLTPDAQGDFYYGEGQEFVLWENGINVWDFFKRDGQMAWHDLLRAQFDVKPGVKYEMCLETSEKYVRATVGDSSFLLRVENLPDEFYIGITGCENINRIYSVIFE